ncbi:hypothetical protein [Bradyrhizobium sp. USDA 4369]
MVDAHAGQQRAIESYLALLRPIEAAEAIHQGGLAGTVRPDHREQLVHPDRDGHIVKRDNATESHPDTVGDENRGILRRTALRC